MQTKVRFIHLRSRKNGVAQDRGGYTVGIKQRTNGEFSVSICQCHTNQKYNEELGEKTARERLRQGQFFVQDRTTLVDTLNTLHNKLCSGVVPRLNLDVLEEPAQAAA